MTEFSTILRELSALTIAVFVVITFSGGAATHALLTDSQTTNGETITLAKKNGGQVSFNKCKQVDFTPDAPSNFNVNVTTTGQSGATKTYNFTDADFAGSGPEFSLQTGNNKKLDKNDEIRQITLDGTTYSNPNYPGGC